MSTWAKPWDHRLDVSDVFHREDLSTAEIAKTIADRIRNKPFYDEDDADLYSIVDELAEVEDKDHFNEVWSWFYDWCDAGKRVWVDTYPKRQAVG